MEPANANRKLIRPSLNEMKEQVNPRRADVKKATPPDQTNAENFYYMKQMLSKTPMVIVLKDGETATEAELKAFCQDKLAKFKVPTQIEFRSELPKTTVGKVLRRELVRQHKEKTAATAPAASTPP